MSDLIVSSVMMLASFVMPAPAPAHHDASVTTTKATTTVSVAADRDVISKRNAEIKKMMAATAND